MPGDVLRRSPGKFPGVNPSESVLCRHARLCHMTAHRLTTTHETSALPSCLNRSQFDCGTGLRRRPKVTLGIRRPVEMGSTRRRRKGLESQAAKPFDIPHKSFVVLAEGRVRKTVGMTGRLLNFFGAPFWDLKRHLLPSCDKLCHAPFCRDRPEELSIGLRIQRMAPP